jgi:signal transduction histidine kinase
VTQVRYDAGSSGELKPRVLASVRASESVLDESAARFLESPLHLHASELLRNVVHGGRIQRLDLEAPVDDPLLDLARAHSLGQCVACPLQFQGRTLGLALVAAAASSNLGEDGDGRLLWALASQAACALSNALLVDDEKRRTFERSLLLDAARTAASSLDLESGVQGFAALAARCMEAEQVALYLLESRVPRATLAAWWASDARSLGSPLGSSGLAAFELAHEDWIRQAVESGLPCLLRPDEGTRLGPAEAAMLRASPAISALMIWPVQDARACLGVLLVGLSEDSVTHALRFDLMDGLVRQLSVFVQNARLFDEVRLRAERMTAISEVTEAVNSSLDVHAIFGIAVRSLRFIVPADVTALAVFSRKRNQIEIPMMRFADDDRVLPKQIYPFEGSLPARAAASHEAVLCDDLKAAARTPLEAHLLGHGVRSLLVLPLRLEGKVRAALLVGYRRPGVVTPEQVEVLGEVSVHLATALRNAEMFDEIRRINDDLRRKDAVKSDFFSHVAHDLRTPLTIVKGYVYVLLRGGEYQLPADVIETLETIDHEADHLKELIENLISLAHLDATTDIQVPLRVRDVNLADVVGEVLTNFRGMAAKHRVRLQAEVPADLVWPVDRGMLVRVFYNLLGNALKFTRDGAVSVRLTRDAQGVLCAVADEGPGIAPEHVERIFERFYHVDEVGENKVHGTGLGLSIVHSIVRAHGGRVWVESTLGKGTTFWFTLPAPQGTDPGALPVVAP